MAKTIEDVIEKDPKDMEFKDRAAAFETDLKPLTEKWGVTIWALLSKTDEALIAVPGFKDLWEKKEG